MEMVKQEQYHHLILLRRYPVHLIREFKLSDLTFSQIDLKMSCQIVGLL